MLIRFLNQAAIFISPVPETCMWWDAANLPYGRTRNPYDLSRIPGGSSGGEAALISAAGSPFGIGSDVGGSIRLPAFFCGLFGHKCTPGLIPLGGVWPEIKPLLNTLGPLCRYASDLKPMLKAMCSEEGYQRINLDSEVRIADLKIFYSLGFDIPRLTRVTPEIMVAMHKAVQHLKGRSKSVQQAHFEQFKEAHRIAAALWVEEEPTPVSRVLSLGKHPINTTTEFVRWACRLSTHTLAAILFAKLEDSIPAKGSAWQKKYAKLGEGIKSELYQLLGDDGVLIFPTHPEPAPKHGTPIFKFDNFLYTWLWNTMKVCSTNVPMGLDSDGLPIGFQVIAAPFNDRLTIAVAEELSKNCGAVWTSPSPVKLKKTTI